MADWRQIQARIRKAKASTDAAAQLAELYERTRDAMVAFELARWQEKAGEHAEAARWYTAAAERFRRSQWKTKAEAALARLRTPKSPAEPVQEASALEVASSAASPRAVAAPSEASAEFQESDTRGEVPASPGELETSRSIGSAQRPVIGESDARGAGIDETTDAERSAAPMRKGPRRRGRRGGRNRHRPVKQTATGPSLASTPVQAESSHIEPASEIHPQGASVAMPVPEISAPVEAASGAAPPMAAWRGRSRAGEPALASRMAHLESQLRRLLVCPQAKLEQAESAPAGPGVLLVSDSDQVTHYYVESCQTLRIAIGNLTRGGRGAKDIPRLKERLADNLGIAESRVTNYLKEHCAVRWLQLDEGASELAHFAIAVLKPVANE